MRKVIYLDIDDTLLDTEGYIRRNLIGGRPFTGSIYTLGTSRLNGYFCPNNYKKIPFKEGALDVLKILSQDYEIILASCCRTVEESISKRNLARSLGKRVILCRGNDKSNIDMNGAIFIDDRSDILASSNASYKIRMYNAYTEGYQLPLKTCDLVHSWYGILDLLENTDTDTSILGDYLSLLFR